MINSKLRKLIYVSLMVSIGLILSIVESMLPIPISIPGFKLGISNIVGLIMLLKYGYKEGLYVIILKGILFALATGNFMALPYSLSGGILSISIMYISNKHMSRIFSLVGVSILGAVAHNLGQILIGMVIIENWRIISYFPYMAILSIFSGSFIGILSIKLKYLITDILQ